MLFVGMLILNKMAALNEALCSNTVILCSHAYSSVHYVQHAAVVKETNQRLTAGVAGVLSTGYETKQALHNKPIQEKVERATKRCQHTQPNVI